MIHKSKIKYMNLNVFKAKKNICRIYWEKFQVKTQGTYPCVIKYNRDNSKYAENRLHAA